MTPRVRYVSEWVDGQRPHATGLVALLDTGWESLERDGHWYKIDETEMVSWEDVTV